jgi:hypothetical protein
MNPEDYDPQEALDYLTLVKTLARVFREVTSFTDLVGKLGEESLTDVTQVPWVQSMESARGPLPPGFTERVYQFRDPRLGRGIMDASFHDDECVNMRAQLYFDGWFGRSKARKYLHEVLLPLFQGIFGRPFEETSDGYVFNASGLLCVVRHVPSPPYVSVWLTEERFA